MNQNNNTQNTNPKFKLKLWVKVFLWTLLLIVLFFVGKFLISALTHKPEESLETETVSEFFMGVCVDSLQVDEYTVQNNQTLSDILFDYGITANTIHNIANVDKEKFDVRNIKAGNKYYMISTTDSIPTAKYFIYGKNKIDYAICSLNDSVEVSLFSKEITTERKKLSAEINSSLYMAIKNAGGSDELTSIMADVYQWTIDFYGIQKGDSFDVMYDVLKVDSSEIGIKNIIAAKFVHMNKDYYAIGYEDGGKKGFWDQDGESLKKSFLKAPLKFSRISSTFSNARRHPVLRIVRPHHGVDYAAPAGTPVWAVADGVVVRRSFDRGGGNTIKIKHNVRGGRYTTGYLHLRAFAKGITVGKHVSQGDVIGYVGSTGLSTGPHLDYRIWENGKPVNPLRMTQEKGKPISDSLKVQFMNYKDSIIGVLYAKIDTLQNGKITDRNN